ncbi:MAG: 3D domain-containing protein [Candidatus Jorgensenbacteria bacterium]
MFTYFIATFVGISILAYPLIGGYAILQPSQVLPEGVTRVAEASELAAHGIATPHEYEVWVTAYSSSPDETDSTPFTTAMNSETHDGIVAANFLPLGSKIKIPALFGDKVFLVEDRMHRRKTDFVDVWMATKEAAQHFGITRAVVEVL